MPYATSDDVFTRYNPIKTMVGTAEQDVKTADIASIYISDAEGLMNAFLAKRYVVPVAAEPLITMLASDIAIYKVLEDRAPRIPEFAQRRYENAMDLLKMLRDGEMILASNSTATNSGGDQEVWSNVLDTPPIFKNAELAVSSGSVRSYANDGLW